MQIFFRVDASVDIGSGHVMRCLALADEFRNRGVSVKFMCKMHPGNFIDFIEAKKGFPVYKLPIDDRVDQATYKENEYDAWIGGDWCEDASTVSGILKDQLSFVDWLIVDHYSIDRRWQEMIRSHVGKVMVIDDLADRQHDCDLLLDQNYHLDKDRYQELVPDHCTELLGPKYAILRSEFLKAREKLRVRTGKIKRIFVFFGGSDVTNETGKVLKAITNSNLQGVYVDVVVGKGNPHRAQLDKTISSLSNVKGHFHINNMAELMSQADVAFGAGGTTQWERCCLGLPSIITALASNQVATAESLSQQDIILYLGKSSEIKQYDIKRILNEISKGTRYHELIEKGKCLVDGKGVLRICDIFFDR